MMCFQKGAGISLGSPSLFWNNSEVTQRAEQEMERRLGNHGDPERPSKKEPEDKYIAFGLFGGMAIGAVTGLLLALATGAIGVFVAAIIGGVLGGVVGALLGNQVKKSNQSNRLRTSGR